MTMRIVLVPLDERPVNVEIPREVAAIAGARLIIPPAEAMPAMRVPADLAALHEWVEREAMDPATTHLVVCIDTLVFGGIIPARITDDATSAALARLDLIARIARARPDLTISAVSLVMRASNSYSAVEEPEYWADYGRELHALGGALHHAFESDVAATRTAGEDAAPVPDEVVRDFELRRLRNHIVNLASLGLHEAGDIATLAITADDTVPHSAGSAEQVWLRHWARALPAGRSALMYPGADEVGGILVARTLTADAGSPAIALVCAEPGGLDRVPNFENVPVSEGLRRQVEAAGGRVVSSEADADIVLVVHAPDPARGDCFGATPAGDPAAAHATADAVAAALAGDAAVALADVRYSNGGDPLVVDELAERGLLLELSSYGGWNTAGNSIGSTVAHAIARWAGTQTGTLDARAAESALLARILEDRGYQSGARGRLQATVFGGEIGPVAAETQRAAAGRITAELQAYLDDLTEGRTRWTLGDVRLPWGRSFEIGFALTPDKIG